MKLKIPPFIRKALLAALLFSANYATTLYAGKMHASYGIDIYRNLAENRDIFEVGATGVEIYDLAGNYMGTLPVIPDFSPYADTYGNASGALAGGQTWVLGCEHIGSAGQVNFGHKMGTGSTPVHQTYLEVKRVAPSYGENYVDLAVHRLNKVATDAINWELATDNYYTDTLSGLSETNFWRIGAGTQVIYDENNNALKNYGAYTYVTAGLVSPDSIRPRTAIFSNGRGDEAELYAHTVRYMALLHSPDSNPMPVPGKSGDSGSPNFIYNPDTRSFQYYGNHYASNTPSDASNPSYIAHSDEYYDFVISSSEKHFNSAENSWTIGAADANGIVSFTGNLLGESTTVRALRQGERGDTSTVGIRATNDEMWESLDWAFSNDELDLHFTGDVNTGAGAIHFLRGENSSLLNPSYYELSSSDPSVNFQTAGYIIEEHVYVRSTLTGREGDEWRIVGENARISLSNEFDVYGGFFELAGSGNNDVDLNLGVGVTVFLNRENGHAAQNVQLNTHSTVILASSNQISGDVLFGAMGGTLDINDNDFARTSANLYTFNDDAAIVNNGNGVANFTYTVVGAEQGIVKSSFGDSSSHFVDGTGVLNITVNSADGATGGAHFSDDIVIAGNMTITNTDTVITGRQVEVASWDAYPVYPTYSTAYSPDKWEQVNVNVDSFNVTGSALTFGPSLHVEARELNISADSSLSMLATSSFNGVMNLQGNANFEGDTSVAGQMNIASGVVVNMLYGGNHEADVNVASAASLNIAGDTTISGAIVNQGTMNLSGKVAFSQTISNSSGNINIANDIMLDLSKLIESNGGSVENMSFYTGGTALGFTSLDSSNVIGQGTEMHVWDFLADGSVIARNPLREVGFSGGNILLAENAAGFNNAERFTDGSGIHFTGADAHVTLGAANLSSERIFVDNANVSITANGNTLDVDRLVLSSGSSLSLIGEAISDNTRIMQQNGATDVSVTLDMLGETYSGKAWEDVYTGRLNLSNGAYDFGVGTPAASTIYLDADATAIVNGHETQTMNVLGYGTLSMQGVDSLYIDNIADFHGIIESSATAMSFQKSTMAGIRIDEGQTLYLQNYVPYEGSVNISGAIIGSGEINVAELDTTAVLADVSQFTGNINVGTQGHLSISGSTSLEDIQLSIRAHLSITDGSHIVNTASGSRSVFATIDLGEGAILDESNIHYGQLGVTLSFTGSGYHMIKGLGLSVRHVADTVNILGDATVHILGTNDYYTSAGTGSFQLSTWFPQNTINIEGTLISEASISSKNGYGVINIHEGGSLILKRGGTFHHETAQPSYINVETGGSLILGNQLNNTDYGQIDRNGRLEVRMSEGSTIGGYGTGDVTIRHSIYGATENAKAYILTSADQNLHMTGEMGDIHAHIIGDGGITLHNARHANSITVEAPEVTFAQASVALDELNIRTAAQLNRTADVVSEIAVNSLNFNGNQSQIRFGAHLDSIKFSSNSARLAQAGSLLVTGKGAEQGVINVQEWRNVNIAGATISGFNDVTVNNVSISDSSLDASNAFTVESGSQLYLSDSNLAADLTVERGASAYLSGAMTVTGELANNGTLQLAGNLTLGESMLNAGDLLFDGNINIDISMLQAEQLGEGVLYRIFTGENSVSFTELTTENLAGLQGSDSWIFHGSGVILSSDAAIGGSPQNLNYAGGRLYLADYTNGFEGNKLFFNGSSIHFAGAETNVTLAQDNLHMANLLLDATHLSIDANGRELQVDDFSMTNGASLEIIGEALAADVVINTVDGASDTNIILDMESGTYQNKDWLNSYTGQLSLRNGTYELGQSLKNLQQVNLASDVRLIVRETEPINSSIAGSGHVDVQQSARVELGALSQFTGRIDSTSSHLVLGGSADNITLNRAANSTLELLAGAQISTQSNLGYYWATNYQIIVGENAHLNQASTQLRIHGGTVNVGGSGTYTVKGIGLSASNSETTLNINDDVTLHLAGNTDNNMSNADGTFQISTWAKTNTINIAGTLISEAGISSRDGNANINILDGGLLELKKGPVFNYSSRKVSTIQVQDGGTLLLGNQSNTTDYGSLSNDGRLEVHMHAGSTLGASGADDLTIYHTLMATNNADVSFVTKVDQDITVVSALSDMHVHAVGDGSLTVENTGAARNFSVSAKALNFTQQNVQLDSLQVEGVDSKVNFGANTESVQIGNTAIANTGGMSIERNGAQQGSMVQNEFRNVTIKNAALSGAQNVSLSNVSLSNTRITQSQFQVSSGQSLISNSIVQQDTSFTLQAGAQLRLENTHISHYGSNTFTLVSGLSADISNMITLSNTTVSLESSLTRYESGTALFDMFTITGFNSLISEVTVDNLLYIEVAGVDFSNLYSSNPYYLYVNFENQYFAKGDAIIDQVILTSGDYDIALGDAHHLGGSFAFNSSMYPSVNAMAFSAQNATAQFSMIPEPSTATLSLLALSGLLLRRRRKKA